MVSMLGWDLWREELEQSQGLVQFCCSGMLLTEKLLSFDASETEKYLVAGCPCDFILLSWGWGGLVQ